MRYQEALSKLDSLVNYEKLAKPRDTFKLDDIRGLLELAGNPQLQLKHTVLVAGTKGKGSVCYMLEAALRACGRKTGMFISPHVSTVRERIQVNGTPITKREFSRGLDRLWPMVCKQPVSYFELTAALAFDFFVCNDVDFAILEVGLGGRLDATNLSEPDISVITRIGLDHTRVLGNSISRIAAEKSGIMRAGRPVVVGRQPGAGQREIARQARTRGAVITMAQQRARTWDVQVERDSVRFSVLSEVGAGRIRLPLLGIHQVENCSTAIAVLGLLAHDDPDISFHRVRQGIESVNIPARCQIVSREPLVVVDSCHNPDSGRALAEVTASHLGGRAVLVYGSLRGKQILPTLRPLVRWVEHAFLVRPNSPRAVDIVELKRIFGRLGIPYSTAPSVRSGIDSAILRAQGSHPVVVAGSFYVAGEAVDYLAPGSGD